MAHRLTIAPLLITLVLCLSPSPARAGNCYVDCLLFPYDGCCLFDPCPSCPDADYCNGQETSCDAAGNCDPAAPPSITVSLLDQVYPEYDARITATLSDPITRDYYVLQQACPGADLCSFYFFFGDYQLIDTGGYATTTDCADTVNNGWLRVCAEGPHPNQDCICYGSFKWTLLGNPAVAASVIRGRVPSAAGQSISVVTGGWGIENEQFVLYPMCDAANTISFSVQRQTLGLSLKNLSDGSGGSSLTVHEGDVIEATFTISPAVPLWQRGGVAITFDLVDADDPDAAVSFATNSSIFAERDCCDWESVVSLCPGQSQIKRYIFVKPELPELQTLALRASVGAHPFATYAPELIVYTTAEFEILPAVDLIVELPGGQALSESQEDQVPVVMPINRDYDEQNEYCPGVLVADNMPLDKRVASQTCPPGCTDPSNCPPSCQDTEQVILPDTDDDLVDATLVLHGKGPARWYLSGVAGPWSPGCYGGPIYAWWWNGDAGRWEEAPIDPYGEVNVELPQTIALKFEAMSAVWPEWPADQSTCPSPDSPLCAAPVKAGLRIHYPRDLDATRDPAAAYCPAAGLEPVCYDPLLTCPNSPSCCNDQHPCCWVPGMCWCDPQDPCSESHLHTHCKYPPEICNTIYTTPDTVHLQPVSADLGVDGLSDAVEDDPNGPGRYIGMNDDFDERKDDEDHVDDSPERSDSALDGVQLAWDDMVKLDIAFLPALPGNLRCGAQDPPCTIYQEASVKLTGGRDKLRVFARNPNCTNGQPIPWLPCPNGQPPLCADSSPPPCTGGVPPQCSDGSPGVRDECWAPIGETDELAAEYFREDSARRLWEFMVEGIEPGTAELTLELRIGSQLFEDTVKFTVVKIDADVDSDNNDGFNLPERSREEDRIEDRFADPDHPGKLVGANDGDEDEDGVPDFADGFNLDGLLGNEDDVVDSQSATFTPLVLQLDGAVNTDIATLSFSYPDETGMYDESSNPAHVTRSGDEAPYTYTAAAGRSRVWTKNAHEVRNKAGLGDQPPGDYVAPGVYRARQLGFNGPGTVTLYIEGIRASGEAGANPIRVSLDPDGAEGPAGIVHSDTTRTTILGVTLLQGLVDPASGRGMTGPPSSVLRPLPESGLEWVSNPIPAVNIEASTVTVGNIRYEGGKLVGDIHVSGTVTSPIADVIPDGSGDPAEAQVWLNASLVGGLALQRVQEETSFLRPRAARFEFSGDIVGKQVQAFTNSLQITVEDPLLHNVGHDLLQFTVMPLGADDPYNPPPPQNPPDTLAAVTNNVYQFQLDLSAGDSLEAIEAAGIGAVTTARRVPEVNASYQPTATSLVIAGPNGVPRVFDANNEINLDLTDTTHIGLDSTTMGVIVGQYELTGVLPRRTVVLRETAPDTSIYVASFLKVTCVFTTGFRNDMTDEAALTVEELQNDTLLSTDSIVLTETGSASRVFEAGSYRLTVPADATPDSAEVDHMRVDLDLSLRGVHRFDLSETNQDSLTFNCDRNPLPVWDGTSTQDPLVLWMNGPWLVSDLQDMEAPQRGPYSPIAVRIDGPLELLRRLIGQYTVEVFGQDHHLMEMDGVIYSQGDGIPGLFIVAPIDPGVPDADVIGAGHISKKEGFVFAGLKSSTLAQKALASSKRKYAYAGMRLFSALLALGSQLRADRFSGDAARIRDSYYYSDPPPPQKPGTGDDEPFRRFTNKAWNDFFVPARGANPLFDRSVTLAAWRELTATIPVPPGQGPANLPFGANALYARVWSSPPGPIQQVGSPYLIGHCIPPKVNEMVLDFFSQTQNITQVMHWNGGAGYGPIAFKLVAFLYPFPSSDNLNYRGMILVRFLQADAFYLLGRFTNQPDGLTDTEMEAAKELARRIRDTYTSTTFLGIPGLWPGPDSGRVISTYATEINALFARITTLRRYIEFAKIALMTQVWFGRPTRDSLDLFLAYDIASGEGFDQFGIDALDDIMATEGGALLGETVAGGFVFDSVDTFRSKTNETIQTARQGLLSHPVLNNRRRVLQAFLTVQYSYDNGTGKFASPRLTLWPDSGVWRSTMGMILQTNDRYLTSIQRYSQFAETVRQHLTKPGRRCEALNVPSTLPYLSADDTQSLFEMVEVLSLIGEGFTP